MKRVLITGAHGFVGTNLSEALAVPGHTELIALDLERRSRSRYSVQHTWEDFQNIDFDSIDTIIHLAGKAHDTRNTTLEQEYFDVNLGLTVRICQAFVRSKVHKLVFFSSVKAVADGLPAGVLTEDAVPNPTTPYGKSKLAAEKHILNLNCADGKKIYVLRPCMIHGPGNKGNLNLLYGLVKQGIPYPLGKFDNLRSFASIENVIYVIRELLDKPIKPGVYQLGDDDPISTNELIGLIAGSLERRPRIWNLPGGLVRSMARTGDLLHLPLNSERLRKLTESFVVSNQKLKLALGIKKLPVSAREGLLHTFESLLEVSRKIG